jgi:hypothetical protein
MHDVAIVIMRNTKSVIIGPRYLLSFQREHLEMRNIIATMIKLSTIKKLLLCY